MKKILFFIGLAASVTMMDAQVKAPQPSPAATVKQNVGLSEITVEYSRPSAKNRSIFGDLVPYNQLWRTGANSATSISFNSEVNFGGKTVPAGTYALYSIPKANEWEIILYKDTKVWGAPKTLDENQIATKSVQKSVKISPAVESFQITFDDLRNNGANLVISWENTMVKVPITVDSKKEVLASIEKTMNGPSANDYYQAASYYLDEKMELDKALEWSKKAIQMRPDAFWMTKQQSEIYAEKGDFKNAISSAKNSLEVAKKAGNEDYVKMNEENIKKWSKK
ncbi:MAG: DUF2911 domain-containing protein [Flavobacteriaceae bacterium]|nr:DUF2911 domain-containing protein [Flavobacteriaceae bacterium]